MKMKIDLRDLAPNDKFFSATHGECVVDTMTMVVTRGIISLDARSLSSNGNINLRGILADGRQVCHAEHPCFFHSAQECADYFAHVAKTEEEKNSWTMGKMRKAIKFGDTFVQDRGLSGGSSGVFAFPGVGGFCFLCDKTGERDAFSTLSDDHMDKFKFFRDGKEIDPASVEV